MKNIYLRALQIGYESKSAGISYNALKKQLTEEKYKVKDDVFRYWYYENFGSSIRRNLKHNPNAINLTKPFGYDNTKHSLFSEAIMDYVDYLELKEARESSRKAIRFAQKAFIVSIIALFVNVIFSVMSILQVQKVSVSTISSQAQEQVTKKILSQSDNLSKEEGLQDRIPQKKEVDSTMQTQSKKDTLEFQAQKQ